MGKGNQITALRFQTGDGHQTSPNSLRGQAEGRVLVWTLLVILIMCCLAVASLAILPTQKCNTGLLTPTVQGCFGRPERISLNVTSGVRLAGPTVTSTGLLITATGVSRCGLAVRRQAGKQRDLGSSPLWFSFFFKSCWSVDTLKRQVLVCDILQTLPYLVTPQVPENCHLTSSFLLVLNQQ